MNESIQVAFASGTDALNAELLKRMEALAPELPLYVVSEFPPERGQWVPYHVLRSFGENYRRCRAAFRRKRIRYAGVLLVPRVPYRRMRLIALLLSPLGFIGFNEHLDHFMLRPWCAGTIARHAAWRVKNFIRWQVNPGGPLYTFCWRLIQPREWRRPLACTGALLGGWAAAALKAFWPARRETLQSASLPDGISVVIPSRNGRSLLERLLPGLCLELSGFASEIIVVDNGSEDGTDSWLRVEHPDAVVVESAAPLSFARAVNQGIARARYSHLCLLNNDMVLEPGFFAPLRSAFEQVPELFCATAQILFPEGARREETGKAVMPLRRRTEDFPVRCELPLEGEDLSYVLYGSGGCSLYATAKLRALGGLDEIYEPAYVEDLDIGYRAWLSGWPTVFAAGARVVHAHRATTSRYFSAAELERVLELNYLKFLARVVASGGTFRRLWREAIRRLNCLAAQGNQAALEALAAGWRAPWLVRGGGAPVMPDELVLAIGSGDVAVFPGRARAGHPVVLIASPYLPFPLAHGGAVRIYNLMRRAAADYDQVLVAFTDELATPPVELLEICAEVVLVRRRGSHSRPSTERPDVVEEFASEAFRAALRETERRWRPALAQLEFTQMAQYAPDCAPARTLLVEHDVTVDLYQQLLREREDWELRRQYERWRRFEAAAWQQVDCVVTMSEKDRRTVRAACAVCLPNGVDLERFRPSSQEPEQRRLLFIGSFAHLPNVMAVEFFLREVWPRLNAAESVLHIIAGARYRYFLEHYKDRVTVDLRPPGLEVEDFVADVRPAYERAAVVIAPLVASAGTNIKILEAMAMGKAIVSTPAGINGLDLEAGRDVVVVSGGEQMAAAITELLENPEKRCQLENQARRSAERDWGWDAVAERQRELYRKIMAADERR